MRKSRALKEMTGDYIGCTYIIGKRPKMRTYWLVLPKNKKTELPTPEEAIKLVNSRLKTKVDTLSARYAVIFKEGKGKKYKEFFRVKDIHMDEVNCLIVYRKKNSRYAVKDIESITEQTKRNPE